MNYDNISESIKAINMVTLQVEDIYLLKRPKSSTDR